MPRAREDGSKFACYMWEGYRRHTGPELHTGGMRVVLESLAPCQARVRWWRLPALLLGYFSRVFMLATMLAAASMRTRSIRMSLPKVGGRIQFGDEELMAPKGHGTTAHPVQENLRWNVDHATADRICSFNREAAELRGYWKTESCFLQEMRRSCTLPVSFYDSVSGDLLFVAPVGRSMAEFLAESDHHGWPSFRDAEVVWDNVRVLGPSDEAVSKAGTHLGHNLPVWQVDSSGISILENRYCINLVSVAGRAPGNGGEVGEMAKLQARASSWELRTSQRLLSALRARTGRSRPLALLDDFYDANSGLCSEGVWHNAWLGIASLLAARELQS